MNDKKLLHKRYEWLDQFRGLVVWFLILATITWGLSGDWSGGNPRQKRNHDQNLILFIEFACYFSLPGFGPAVSVNRAVRTRLLRGVGAGGEKPPATRL